MISVVHDDDTSNQAGSSRMQQGVACHPRVRWFSNDAASAKEDLQAGISTGTVALLVCSRFLKAAHKGVVHSSCSVSFETRCDGWEFAATLYQCLHSEHVSTGIAL